MRADNKTKVSKAILEMFEHAFFSKQFINMIALRVYFFGRDLNCKLKLKF